MELYETHHRARPRRGFNFPFNFHAITLAETYDCSMNVRSLLGLTIGIYSINMLNRIMPRVFISVTVQQYTFVMLV